MLWWGVEEVVGHGFSQDGGQRSSLHGQTWVGSPRPDDGEPSRMEICQPQMYLPAPELKISLQTQGRRPSYPRNGDRLPTLKVKMPRDGAPQNTRKNPPNPKAGNSPNHKERDLPSLQLSKTQGWRLTNFKDRAPSPEYGDLPTLMMWSL